ncbi:MAG: hypothetical protein ACK56I_19085, partial [bacterium]
HYIEFQSCPSILVEVVRHGLEFELLVALKLEHVVVVLPERVPVRHRDQRDADALHVRVQVTLNVY